MTIPNDTTTIWRYMDVAKYVSLLANGLFFCRSTVFSDEWEGSWGGKDIDAFRNQNKLLNTNRISETWQSNLEKKQHSLASIGISCWNQSEYENAALWALYMPRGLGVAIKTQVGRLLRSLQDTGRTVIPRRLEYMDYTDTSLGNDPINLLSHKRRVFEHEREIRFFLHYSDDEKNLMDYKNKISEIRNKRNVTSGNPIPLVITHGQVPSEDQGLFDQVTPEGMYLKVDLNTLIEDVYLVPQVPEYVR